MSTHFCRVARIKPNLTKLTTIKALEHKLELFIEEKKKLDFSIKGLRAKK